MARKYEKWRDDFKLLIGTAGLAYETVWDDRREPSLILVFAALVGLAVPGYAERYKDKHGGSGGDSGKGSS